MATDPAWSPGYGAAPSADLDATQRFDPVSVPALDPDGEPQHLPELQPDSGEPEENTRGRGGRRRAGTPAQRRFWRELVTIVVAAAALTLLAKAFVVQVYRIPSGSMENTLLVGDRVLVNKLVYHFRSIDRGDIVVFSGQGSWGPDPAPPPGNPVLRTSDDVLGWLGLHSAQTFYIKRVIGLPGDRVACCTNGKVTVNGVPLTESDYILPGSTEQTFGPVTVAAGHLWVMGDNRDNSWDSRGHSVGYPDQGAVPESAVVGRAFFKIWPVSQFGDLPIPATFQQAALHSGASGATMRTTVGAVSLGTSAIGAVATVPVPVAAGAAGLVSTPFLLRRRRRT